MANASPIGRAVAFGTVTVNGTNAVSVTFPQITKNMLILFSLNTTGGTATQNPYAFTTTPGTGFTVKAGGSDTSIYNWIAVQIEKAS